MFEMPKYKISSNTNPLTSENQSESLPPGVCYFCKTYQIAPYCKALLILKKNLQLVHC